MSVLARTLDHLRARAATPPADGDLLARFVAARDGDAFAELVRRYGPLVRGVARRRLADPHEADDVVQATFLALARQASRLGRGRPLAGWLFTVAHRLAGKAGRRAARRPGPPPADVSTAADPLAALTARELLAALDDELARLPDRYRLPLVLCALEGLSRDEAAARLGWTLGALRGRLERGRELLRKRLTARGLTVPAALAGGLLAAPAEALPLGLVQTIARAAAAMPAAGGAGRGLAILLTAMALSAGVGAAVWPGSTADGPPASLPPPPVAAAPEPRADALGDPLPVGAVARLGSHRLRPGDRIEALTFSPDGKRLTCWAMTQSHGGVLTVWDATTGQLLRRADLPHVELKLLRWLPDGRGVAVVRVGMDDYYVWDFADATAPVPHVAGPPFNGYRDGNLIAVAVSPDGTRLATGRLTLGNGPRAIEVWDLALNKPLKDLPVRAVGAQVGHGVGLIFTPDGRTLLAFSRRLQRPQGEVQFGAPVAVPGEPAEHARLVAWDVAGGQEVVSFDVTAPGAFTLGFGVSRPVPQTFAVTHDGGTLIVGQRDGAIRLWDWRTGTEVRSWTAHPAGGQRFDTAGVLGVAIGPDGRTLVTAGMYGGLRRWDLTTGREVRPPAPAGQRDHVLAVSPDGKQLAAGGSAGQITIQDFATGAVICDVPGHRGSVDCVAVAPDGRTASTAGADGTACLWDLGTGRQISRVSVDKPSLAWPTAFTPDRRELIGRSIWRTSGRVYPYEKYLWDLSTGQRRPVPEALADPRLWVLTAPAGGTFLVLDVQDQSVTLRDWPSQRARQTFARPEVAKPANAYETQTAAVSADGRLVAAVGHGVARSVTMSQYQAGHFSLYDATTGRVRHHRVTPDARYEHLTFTPDGAGVVVGGVPHILPTPVGAPRPAYQPQLALVLLDAATGKPVRSFLPTTLDPTGFRMVTALAVSHDGRQLAAAERDHSVWVYEVATGKLRRHLAGHTNEVTALAFTPDGRRLVSASRDLTGLVWDVSLAAAGRAGPAPTPATFDRLWADLAKPEWELAGPALATLAAHPDEALPLLRERLRPAAGAGGADPAALTALIDQLDSPTFAERERAAAALRRRGSDALPAVRERLAKPASAEMKQRLAKLVEEIRASPVPADGLRALRAVEVLEQVAAPEAREHLKALAGGAAGATLTRAAADAVNRFPK